MVSDAFDDDPHQMKGSQPPLHHAMSVGRSDAGEDLNGCDGHTPEGSGDDMMNFIKDRITNLICKWALLNMVICVINHNRGGWALMYPSLSVTPFHGRRC